MKSALFLLALPLAALAGLTEEQQKVPLEKDSPDPKLAKIVLIAGSVSNKAGQHEYFAGCSLMLERSCRFSSPRAGRESRHSSMPEPATWRCIRPSKFQPTARRNTSCGS